MREKIFLLVVAVLSTFTTNAQLVAEYTFEGDVATPSFVDNAVLSSAGPVNEGTVQIISFVNGFGGGRARHIQNWTTAITPNLNQHFRLTLTKALSTDVTITRVEFNEARSASGPLEIQMRTSADGFSSIVWQQSILGDPGPTSWRSWVIPTLIAIIPPSLEIRFYAFRSESSSGAWRIDNVRIYAEITNLPIELLSFTGEKIDENKVRLLWSTASEQDNDYFTVFRCNDLVTWQEIGRVTGAGSSQSRIDYELVDAFPLVGTNYYKLRQTDFDGTFVDSHVIAVDVDVGDDFIVYPNPVQRGVEFQTSLKVSYIADAAGRRIALENNIIENSGAYTLVHIDESGDVTNCRIIVE